MSRDTFSYDPQDAGDVRDSSPRRPACQHRPGPSDTQDRRNPAPEAPGRGDSTGAREQHSSRDERNDSPRAYYVRDRTYLLRNSEMHSLTEIGKFRVIAVSDLAKYAYDGNRARMERDIRALARQSLVRDNTLEISQKKTLRVVTLTKAGHRVLKNTNQVPDDQPIYHGLVKPREVKHDADLYRLYQKEVARIERGGGRPVRVLLDYELKRNLNRDLALLGPDKDDLDRKGEVAEKDNQAKTRFAGQRFEHLYRGWKVGRVTEGDIRQDFGGNQRRATVHFAAEVLCRFAVPEKESEPRR